MRGRYLVRNAGWNAWLRFSDAVLALMRRRRRERSLPRSRPRRVLVAVGGHLGDAVISTTLLPHLDAAFPGLEIGILTGSWNRKIFEGKSSIRWIHMVDHWKLSRSGRRFVSRFWTTRVTRGAALEEIRNVGYDAALDLSPYYPNSAPILWRAKIPVRVGYTSGGAGSLYTHAIPWSAGEHVSDEHLTLLKQIAPLPSQDAPTRYALAELVNSPQSSSHRQVGDSGAGLVVMHPGAGASRKEWPVTNWQRVAASLIKAGMTVVLTGAGQRQRALADEIAKAVPGCANLCDLLDWDEFRRVVSSARLVISVDTVAMHIAAAQGVPCIALMTSMDDPERWRPLGPESHVLTHAVPCAPCYRSRGCDEMSCIREVSPAEVLAAAAPYVEAVSASAATAT